MNVNSANLIEFNWITNQSVNKLDLKVQYTPSPLNHVPSNNWEKVKRCSSQYRMPISIAKIDKRKYQEMERKSFYLKRILQKRFQDFDKFLSRNKNQPIFLIAKFKSS